MRTFQDKVDGLIDEELRWLRFQKSLRKFSEEKPLQRITIFGPKMQRARLPLSWRTRDEQNEAMERTARVAAVVSAAAVMVASDATVMDAQRVANFLGLTVPHDAESRAKFYKEYGKVFRGPLMDRDMRNLPEEFWEHTLLVSLKSHDHSRATTLRYVAGPNDRVRFMQTFSPHEATVDMIPCWWEYSTDDPEILKLKEVAATFFGSEG